MFKAREIAAELRRIADAIECEPEKELQQPTLSFSFYEKEPFLAIVKALPKPVYKHYTQYSLTISTAPMKDNKEYRVYDYLPVYLVVDVPRDKVCKLIQEAQDAVYECESLLSDAEAAEIV